MPSNDSPTDIVKLLFVIQRYGESIVGGGESMARSIAEGLAARGHQVEVATSSSDDYQVWTKKFFEPLETVNGVTVHRFDALERQEDKFLYLMQRAHGAAILGHPLPLHVEEQWFRTVGPTMPDLDSWLASEGARFDVIVMVTYQYAHLLSVGNTRSSYPSTPVAFVPLAHADVTIALDVFSDLFAIPDLFLYLTEEEKRLVENLFATTVTRARHVVVGAPVVGRSAGMARTESPYVLAVGRLDPSKGFLQLAQAWERITSHDPSFPSLKLVGAGSQKISEFAGVESLGFVDDAELQSLLRGAIAFVHPSSFESFSIVCCEAWLQETPVIVSADCDVLVGQCQRSKGGLWYADDAELAEIVRYFTNDANARQDFGLRGAQFVRQSYAPSTVLDAYETELQTLANRHASTMHTNVQLKLVT
jgi:glycosyltransferase involved in cell wall biosynthesis